MTEVHFAVEGTPVAQPRPRSGVDWRSGRVRIYRDDEHRVHGWRSRVSLAARRAIQAPLLGPVELRLAFFFALAQPPRERAWRVTKPDLDNLVKATADALNGIAWGDDAQVVRLVASKLVAARGDAGGALITIRSLP